MGCNDSTSCNHGTTQISQIYCTIAARKYQVPGIFIPKIKEADNGLPIQEKRQLCRNTLRY